MFRMAVRTADAGEPAARVTASEVELHDFLDNGPEEAVLLLEAALILGQELVKIMEYHPVEYGVFRVTGTIDSVYSRKS